MIVSLPECQIPHFDGIKACSNAHRIYVFMFKGYYQTPTKAYDRS